MVLRGLSGLEELCFTVCSQTYNLFYPGHTKYFFFIPWCLVIFSRDTLPPQQQSPYENEDTYSLICLSSGLQISTFSVLYCLCTVSLFSYSNHSLYSLYIGKLLKALTRIHPISSLNNLEFKSLHRLVYFFKILFYMTGQFL